MQKTIVSDTSCLILLEKIGSLELLRSAYSEITIPSVVASEFGSTLPPWINVEDPSTESYDKVVRYRIDPGEISAIALALDLDDCLLIIDDLRGRLVAESFGIRVTGTLGVLIEAKRSGDIPAIKPLIEKIQATNFRLSEDLIEQVLRRVNE